MKKIKLFVPVLMAVVVIFALSLFSCKKGNKETLQSVEITAQPHRTVFMLGEDFNSAGIEVTANFSSSKKVLTEEEYVLDASAYDSQREGKYEIKVSYTYGATTVETSYSVDVKETVYEGLEVTLADGVESQLQTLPYYLMVKDDVIVKEVGLDGIVKEQPLAWGEYTVKIYIGGTEIEYDGGEIAVLAQKATYQIWAFKNSSMVDGYVLSNFVLVTIS